jgi:integrase
MSNNPNWKGILQSIIADHNGQHGVRNKVVSHRTQSARAHALFHMFGLLRRLGYALDPRHLCGRHVAVLVQYWTAAARLTERCAQTGVRLPVVPYRAATIQQMLSYLRVFGRWIGKPGLVQGAEHYVADRTLVARSYRAEADHGWAGNGVDIEASLAAVARTDAYVAAQLRLMRAFGLRRKEAIMFRPHAALVPPHALPADFAGGTDYLAFLKVKRGTKGGRLRYVAVRHDEQRRALDDARLLVRTAEGHLGRPGLSLKQSLDRFDNVMRKVGVTRQRLGVTSHGLRHQFAGDLFFEIAEVHAPVRGGDPECSADALRAAYLEVARQLGHSRPQISNAYLGTPQQRGGAARRAPRAADGGTDNRSAEHTG